MSCEPADVLKHVRDRKGDNVPTVDAAVFWRGDFSVLTGHRQIYIPKVRFRPHALPPSCDISLQSRRHCLGGSICQLLSGLYPLPQKV